MSSELLGSAENTLKGNLGGAWNILNGYADAYTDLGIGKQFGGAAAAYSLRDVGAMNGPVVRVRRDSDNSEQDFPASAVTQIPDWCNQSVIKPLDVRELNSGGSGDRDGNFVIAKAAYSLRSLGDRQATIANDAAPLNEDTVVPASGKYVVQVRRNVDGTIKSFTADEVTDGTLASFVNESFTSSLPLDVQGSAAAAYSLRNLKTGGTLITSSGDTARADTTGTFVVQVRRSSDDRIKSFTADSITNGDLLSFVNEDLGITLTTAESVSAGSVTNASSTGFTYTNDTTDIGGARIPLSQTIPAGATISVTLTTTKSSGMTPSFRLSSGSAFGVAGDPATSSSSLNGTQTFTIKSTADATSFSFFDTVVGNFTISDFKINSIVYDGHVVTWYDQSGNDNHATQGTADSQPKIVNNGSLVTGGINFDGTDDNLALSSTLGITSAASHFAVINPNGGGADTLFDNRDSSTDGYRIEATSSTKINFDWLSSDAEIDTVSDEGVYYFNKTSSQVQSGVNSGTLVTSSESGSVSVTTVPKIGSRSFSSVLNFFEGTVNELIVYGSDQSEKRRAIEESIATNYGVTLASFSRDGFVRTWYDQSVTDEGGATATGNHAVQTDATEQPLVISNGSVVTNGGLSFNGTTQGLEMPEGSIFSDLNSCSTFVIAKSDITSSTDIAIALSDSDNNKRWYAPIIIGGKLNFGYGSSASAIEYSTADTNKHLFTAIAGSSTAEAFLDGTSKGTVSSVSGQDAVAGINLGGANDTLFWDGNIEEVIIYNTDQTANRGAFEANIAVHYGITAIPTAADPPTVNGFVETWYDQSGNGKDVVQATSTNQPKIVESGVLVTETRSGVTTPAIKFTSDSGTPANSNFLKSSSAYLLSSVSAITTCLVVPAQDDASNQNGILGNNASNNRVSIDHSGANGYRFNMPASRVYSNSGLTVGDVDLYFNVVAGTSAGTDDECFRNNTQLTSHSGTIPSVGADMNSIGARRGGTSSANGTDGNYQEVIIYTSDLRSDGANIRNNIINHYSLPQD